MNRTLLVDIIGAMTAAWCIRAGGLLPVTIVLSPAVHSAALCLYQIKHMDEIKIFRNMPQYFLNFSIGFNPIFPPALATMPLPGRFKSEESTTSDVRF